MSRYAHECQPPEWKERGTGEVRIMKKTENNTARILMRREKTMKVCANHFIKPWMDMRPNCGSKKAWVWKTRADYADEEPKQEVSMSEELRVFYVHILKTMAIKFGTEESAKIFFEEFDKMKQFVSKSETKKKGEEKESDDAAKVPKSDEELQGKLSDLQVSET